MSLLLILSLAAAVRVGAAGPAAVTETRAAPSVLFNGAVASQARLMVRFAGEPQKLAEALVRQVTLAEAAAVADPARAAQAAAERDAAAFLSRSLNDPGFAGAAALRAAGADAAAESVEAAAAAFADPARVQAFSSRMEALRADVAQASRGLAAEALLDRWFVNARPLASPTAVLGAPSEGTSEAARLARLAPAAPPQALPRPAPIETARLVFPEAVQRNAAATPVWRPFGIAAADAATQDYGQRAIIALPDFKMLEHRYQFAINYKDSTLQDRKRHSGTVASTAREIASRLGLSPASQNLAGAIALAHDIGHPPFSHWGETAIKKRLAPYGVAWDHDLNGLRSVNRWSDRPNADLPAAVVEGLAKRYWRFDPSRPLSATNRSPSELPPAVTSRADAAQMHLSELNHLEGQIAAQADRAAFNATDIADGLRIGRIRPELLKEHFPSAYRVYRELLAESAEEFRPKLGIPATTEEIMAAIEADPQMAGSVYRLFAARFRRYLVDDLVRATSANLKAAVASGRLKSAAGVREQERLLVDFSPEMWEEFGRFMKFSRETLFARTAPFEPIVDAALEELLSGRAPMPPPYASRLSAARSPPERILLVAEYMTREMSDRDVLLLVQARAPDVYARQFKGFETAAPGIGAEETLRRLTIALERIRYSASERSGIPVVRLVDVDLSPEKTIPVVWTRVDYVLPIPEVGETIKVPIDGRYRSGERYSKGAPILDAAREPVTGTGIVFFNGATDQWVAARSGRQGRQREVLVVRDVGARTVEQLDERRAKWGDRDNPTLAEINALLRELGQTPGKASATLHVYPSSVEKTAGANGRWEAGRAESARVAYIPHAFEIDFGSGDTQKYYDGAFVVIDGRGGRAVVTPNVAARTLRHTDGTKLSASRVPIQRFGFVSEFQTTREVPAASATTVNLVGMGVSGISAASHLIDRFVLQAMPGRKLVLNFIDPGFQPGGPTYNRPSATNVGMANPIGILGIKDKDGLITELNRDPEKWLALIPRLKDGFDPATRAFDPKTLITHNEYGTYLKDHLRTLIRDIEKLGLPVEIHHIRNSVASARGRTVILKGGEAVEADATVFGIGNALPRKLASMDDPNAFLDDRNGYYRLDDHAWAKGNVNESESTVVLGTGNGALFGALWAIGNGYEGTFLITSPSGALPLPGGKSSPYVREHLTLDRLDSVRARGAPVTARLLKTLFDEELLAAERRGVSWRSVVDSMIPDVNAIWRMMSEKEQKTFMKVYGFAWNNARYRIPDHQWGAVKKLMDSGRIEVAGGLIGVRPVENGWFQVHIRREDGTVRVVRTRKIVNNTGPSRRVEDMPVFAQRLLDSGQAKVHHAGGLAVDDHFRLTDRSGATAKGVYAIGPIVAGAHLEAMTVPAIRENARMLADAILDDLKPQESEADEAALASLRRPLPKPTQAEIETYAREFMATGKTSDPRFPNDPATIPTTRIYGRGLDAEGRRLYRPEREAVHARIVEDALMGKTPGAGKPSFVCVAGGMSVGMTYMQRLLLGEGVLDVKNTVVITPMSFERLPEFVSLSHYQHPESLLLVDEYYDIAAKIVEASLARGLNVLFVDQADAKEPIAHMAARAAREGYETGLLGMTMTPEAYYAASELWLTKFNRLPDHRRGFGDLQEFSSHWKDYSRAFGSSRLFETFFHVDEISKSEDDPGRKEYTVRAVAAARSDARGAAQDVLDFARYEDFLDRGRYLAADADTPDQARRKYPYDDRPQLDRSPARAGARAPDALAAPDSLEGRLERFTAGDFEDKFVRLVRQTSARRAAQAAQR